MLSNKPQSKSQDQKGEKGRAYLYGLEYKKNVLQKMNVWMFQASEIHIKVLKQSNKTYLEDLA